MEFGIKNIFPRTGGCQINLFPGVVAEGDGFQLSSSAVPVINADSADFCGGIPHDGEGPLDTLKAFFQIADIRAYDCKIVFLPVIQVFRVQEQYPFFRGGELKLRLVCQILPFRIQQFDFPDDPRAKGHGVVFPEFRRNPPQGGFSHELFVGNALERMPACGQPQPVVFACQRFRRPVRIDGRFRIGNQFFRRCHCRDIECRQ